LCSPQWSWHRCRRCESRGYYL